LTCSGEPLRDAKGNIVEWVFIGKNMSTLQEVGIAATRVPDKGVVEEAGKTHESATLMFMSNTALIVGDSTLEILKGVVVGYNKRFKKKIKIKESIGLKNVPEKDWPSFIELLVSTF
jgi:hypothetical protein